MKLMLMLLLCCFVSPSYLAADVFIYEASGVINFVYNGGSDADDLVIEGERFTMRFTLDTQEIIGDFDDSSMPFSETYHYRQSYPISVDFSGGFSLVATPQLGGTPWWVAEQTRTIVYTAENPGDPVFRTHSSGHNSDGTNFVFTTPITVDWIDMIYGFQETSTPYQLVKALTSLPGLADFDWNWFSLFFQNFNESGDHTAISGYFDSLILVPSFDCVGFFTPFDEPMAVKKKSMRALPLKFNLFDEFGEITDLSPPPVVEVRVGDDTGSDISEYDGDLLPPGLSDDGNEFRYVTI